MVYGALPHVLALLQSTLLPMSKPGGGFQPTAKSEVWHRLAALYALAACPDVGRSFAPLQLAVGIPGGAQIIGHTLAKGMAAEPSCLTMDPECIQYAVSPAHAAGRCISVPTSAALCHLVVLDPHPPPAAVLPPPSCPHRAFAGRSHAGPSSSPRIVSSAGGAAGTCPRSPLGVRRRHLLARPSERCGSRFPSRERPPRTLGPAGHAAQVLSLLRRGSSWCSGGWRPGHPAHTPWFLVASIPVGDVAFVMAYTNQCASTACTLMDTLDALSLPAQDRWLALHGSMQLRVARLPHVGEWAAVRTAVMEAEGGALQNAGAVLGRETRVRPLCTPS
jgi:hypothetical protein